jgi:hypothetical protein
MKVYFSDRSVSKNIFYTNPKEPMLGAIVSYEEVKKQN